MKTKIVEVDFSLRKKEEDVEEILFMPEAEDFIEVDFMAEDKLLPEFTFNVDVEQKEILDLTLQNPFKLTKD